jgi:hypothetical protein
VLTGEISNKTPGFGTLGVSQGIIGIEPDRLIEVTDSFAIVLEIPTLKMEMALKIRIVRFYITGSTSLRRTILRSEQGHFQRLSDCPGDFLLHSENIFQFAVECSRPELNSVGGVHQFGYDPHPITLLAHCPIEKRAHA